MLFFGIFALTECNDYQNRVEDSYFLKGAANQEIAVNTLSHTATSGFVRGKQFRRFVLTERVESRRVSVAWLFPEGTFANNGRYGERPLRVRQISGAVGIKFIRQNTIQQMVNSKEPPRLYHLRYMCFMEDTSGIRLFCENPERVWSLVHDENASEATFTTPQYSWRNVLIYGGLLPYCLFGFLLLIFSFTKMSDRMPSGIRYILGCFFFPFVVIRKIILAPAWVLKRILRLFSWPKEEEITFGPPSPFRNQQGRYPPSGKLKYVLFRVGKWANK